MTRGQKHGKETVAGILTKRKQVLPAWLGNLCGEDEAYFASRWMRMWGDLLWPL